MKTEKHPCPFCGSTDIKGPYTMGFPVYAECNGCGAKGPSRLTANEANRDWNERTALRVSEDGACQLVVSEEIKREMARSLRKFPTWPTDPLHALGVVSEEHGELVKEVMVGVYAPAARRLGKITQEAIQLVVASTRFVMSLEHYSYTRSHQHPQTEEKP